MTDKSKKLDLLRLKVHERIREIIKLRLKIMLKEKKIISKTFLYLLIPTYFLRAHIMQAHGPLYLKLALLSSILL